MRSHNARRAASLHAGLKIDAALRPTHWHHIRNAIAGAAIRGEHVTVARPRAVSRVRGVDIRSRSIESGVCGIDRRRRIQSCVVRDVAVSSILEGAAIDDTRRHVRSASAPACEHAPCGDFEKAPERLDAWRDQRFRAMGMARKTHFRKIAIPHSSHNSSMSVRRPA